MGALSEARIGVVGGGIMAEAILHNVLGQGLVDASRVRVSDPVEARRAHLSDALGVFVTANNAEAASEADILILAVKPQVATVALPALGKSVRPTGLVVSIIAGLPVPTLRDMLRTEAIVRVMPNTPAQIGQGMSVWIASPAVTEAQVAQTVTILRALGEEIQVTDEAYLDMATALHGSGPAYVFLFIEALIDAGVQMGLARAMAEKLAVQTVLGSAMFARDSGLHPAVLRNMVTSPGGTTAEALYQLEEGGLRALLARSVFAAYRKARQLGGSANA
jgi:pyrroline-5-carboxylate reductase